MKEPSYTIYIEELDRIVSFVDREKEFSQLREVVFRGTAFPFVIYGPEGCGKTSLLRFVARELRSYGDTVVVYVDALEGFDVEKALFSSHREIIDFVQDLISVPLGASIARAVMRVVSRFAQGVGIENRNVVVILDDVYRAIGLDEVDRYTKSLYEWIGYLHEKYRVSNTAIVLTTSEGISKRILSKHTYVSIHMMWNLPRRGFEEFVEQLNPHIDVEEIWMYTGGNPRAVIDLARLGWSIDKWIAKIYEDRIRRALHTIGKDKVLQLAEDPDSDWLSAEKLEEMNLMIELRRGSAIGLQPEKSIELGIGEEWAWQIPAYKQAVKLFAK